MIELHIEGSLTMGMLKRALSSTGADRAAATHHLLIHWDRRDRIRVRIAFGHELAVGATWLFPQRLRDIVAS